MVSFRSFAVPLLTCVSLGSAHVAAQSPIVFSQRIEPSEEDRALEGRDEHIHFGAAAGISGRTALVGMPNDGRVAVFDLGKEGWVRTATLLPSTEGESSFGASIDLDGNTAVISGSRQVDVTPISSLYLFRRLAREWREIANVELASQRYGFVGGAQLQGNIVGIGVTRIDESPSPEPGAVHIYELVKRRENDSEVAEWIGGKRRKGLVLQRTAVIQANDAVPADGFGSSLAMEGPLLVVGAPAVDAAYVFLRLGRQWMQIAKLVSSGGAGISFGASVDIRNGVIAVGAPGYDLPGDEPTIPEGNAYVFLPTRDGWVESQQLNDGQRRFFALFGSNVQLGDDLLAVSAPIEEAVFRAEGHVFVFDWNGQEFTFGREINEIEGTAGTSLDFSGRWLIAGMFPSSALVEQAIGYADIFRFGRDPNRERAEE